MTETAPPVRITEVSAAYWRVTFDNPPLNLVDAALFTGLQEVLARIEAGDDLRVVVFESADEDYFLAHFDMSGNATPVVRAPGPSGLPGVPDIVTRLARSPVVSIAKIRGRVRGLGSEFILACDMRFASRERAVLGQPEVGAGVIPGGGGTEWLPRLVGRGRALEIILGADDFDAEIAERYGYVNRAVPDADLDAFVDNLARRIASFGRRPLAMAKSLVNRGSIPPDEELVEGGTAFNTTLTWPETRERVGDLLGRGLNRPGDVELDLGRHVGPR
jgi:enoyl-CoA hydratase/carnithine racemase